MTWLYTIGLLRCAALLSPTWYILAFMSMGLFSNSYGENCVDSLSPVDSGIELIPGELVVVIENKDENFDVLDSLIIAANKNVTLVGIPELDSLHTRRHLELIKINSFYTEVVGPNAFRLRRNLIGSIIIITLIFPDDSNIAEFIGSYCLFPYVKYTFQNVRGRYLLTKVGNQSWGSLKMSIHNE